MPARADKPGRYQKHRTHRPKESRKRYRLLSPGKPVRGETLSADPGAIGTYTDFRANRMAENGIGDGGKVASHPMREVQAF
jgi:hypothetical protein